MPNKKPLLILGILVVVIGTTCWLITHRPRAVSPQQPNAAEPDSTNTVADDRQLPFSPERESTESLSTIGTNHEQLPTGVDQTIMSVWIEQNKRPQDLYGKVVDQDGNPVVGAKLTGRLSFNTETYGAMRVQVHTTESDAGGLFEFVGLQGARFFVSVEKPGYKWGEKGEGYRPPNTELASPVDRATFIMWKLRGAEPLQHSGVQSRIPYDGTSATFRLSDCTKNSDGDLQITLSRNPLKIRKGREPYDWNVKVQIIGGGLVEATDPYMFWAPENGYQPTLEFGMKATDTSWSPQFRRNYYFKDSKGRFGRVLVDLITNSTRPDTGITLEVWLNPSGSQNLETDGTK
jgi:hypothetical protein